MRSVILSAGRSCFVACPGCYNHFPSQLTKTANILDFIRAYQQRFGLAKITVGGGDPLTRPDLIPLLTGLKALELAISLDTVGTAFLGDAAIRFMGKGVAARVPAVEVARLVNPLGIPLDGATDEVQRLFRRHASVTEQLAILGLLDTVAAGVCVNTVVHAGNTHQITQIAELLSKHECVTQWQLFQFMPIGPLGHRNRARYEISDSAFQLAADQARAAAPAWVEVTAKSARARKNRYLLIDGAGDVWVPAQTAHSSWTAQDVREDRTTLGSVLEPATLDRIQDLDNTLMGAVH